MNSPIPDKAYENIINAGGDLKIPKILDDLGYTESDYDLESWLGDIDIYNASANNRRELDIRDKFIKIRIRYSGEELAIIDFLNTIYRVSYG
jgi:hypothetical protein